MEIKLRDYQLKVVEALQKQGDSVILELPSVRSFCNLKHNPVAQQKVPLVLLTPTAKRMGLDIIAQGGNLTEEEYVERMRAFLAETEKGKDK